MVGLAWARLLKVHVALIHFVDCVADSLTGTVCVHSFCAQTLCGALFTARVTTLDLSSAKLVWHEECIY